MTEGDTLPESLPLVSEKAIRKTRSYQSLRYEWLSSEESLGSEKHPDSIYNAEPVHSNESLDEHINPPSPASTEDTADPLAVLSPSLSPRTPHSQWPIPQLSTIIEQNSIQTLRTTRSAPRLRDSPEKHTTIIHSKVSDRSIHPLHANTTNGCSPEVSMYQTRSLSLNNLDAMLENTMSRTAEHRLSSTSDGAIDWTRLPHYPLQPSQTPPYRSPTPPGLPSFGSREAQTFRLTLDQPRSLWSRLWGPSTEVISEQAQSTNSIASPSVDSDAPPLSPQIGPASPSSEGFRRTLAMIGMARIVTPLSTASKNPRASLPPGVSISTSPGPLTQAEDGTFMRGRFHSRASGHGIGNRALESHPLARRSQSDRWSGIEEQVRAIDKACQRADREASHELRAMTSFERGRMRAQRSRQSGTGSSGNPSMMMSHAFDVDSASLRGSTQSGPRLAGILEDHREQGVLQLGADKPKRRKIEWTRICQAMDCCRNFWFWWCCGCNPDPTDCHGGGLIPERTLLYR